MAQPQLTHVRKRDGRVVPFDRAKLARSINAAAVACGVGDTFYSAEIADAVALHLGRIDAAVATTDDIARAVERMLHDTKHEEIALAYSDFRAQRDHGRARCTVLKPVQQPLLGAEETLQVMFNQEQRTRPWQRGTIVNDLINEARVPRPVAEDIARVVEERILTSELRHVTTTLIRAITDNELLARGYTSALRQRSAVTVSFADLERVLDADDPSAFALELGQRVARPYVLEHIYSEDVAMAHRRGMIHLSGLEHPFAWYARHVSLADERATQTSHRRHLRRALQRIDAGNLTHLAVHLPRAGCHSFSPWLHEVLDYSADLSGPAGVDLVVDANDVRALQESLAGRTPHASARILLCGWSEDVTTLAAMFDDLLQLGWRTGWSPAHALTAVAQRISLNMPQAVYRARSRDIDGVIEELQRTVEIAVQAHRQYCLFGWEYDKFAGPAHAGCGIDLCGLDEALAVLTGSGIFDGGDGSACLQLVLAALRERISQAADAHDLSLSLLADAPDVCGKRLAIIDQALFPELFGFLPMQPENLASVIPAYRGSVCTLDDDMPVERLAEHIAAFRRCFDAGLVRLAPGEAPYSLLTELIGELIERHCAFCLSLPGAPQQEAAISEDQMGLPGIHPEQ